MIEQLALFDTGEIKLSRPSEPIIRGAEFSDDKICRYTLYRRWGSGGCVLWCGMNPSLANLKRDDNTIIREMSFSNSWGYGSMLKVNVFPFISPDPNELYKWLKTPDAESKNKHNWSRIFALAEEEVDLKMAVWGNIRPPLDQAVNSTMARICSEAAEKGSPWYCLGTNANGSPRHTLSRGRNRIPDSALPEIWNG